MAKKAKKKAAPFKNPVIQTFGLLIQSARKKELKSSDILAKDLGVSASLLRLIESGGTTLHANKSDLLIKALPNTPIEFPQLSKLLCACQISERLWSNEKERPQAISEFAELDQGLRDAIQPLTKNWAGFLAEPDSRKRAATLEKMKLPERLLEFLAQKAEPKPETLPPFVKEWAYLLVEGMPPLYLELVESILYGLKQFHPKPTASEITAWEQSLKGRINRIYAVLETVSVIPETYEEFDWRAVADAGVLIISMAEASRKKSEQRSFQKFLEKMKQDNRINLAEKNLENICKLSFVDEKNGCRERINQLKSEQQMREPLIRAAKSARWKEIEKRSIRADFANAWVYEVIPRTPTTSSECYHVVILDDLDMSSNVLFDLRVCTWAETESWADLLQEFWFN